MVPEKLLVLFISSEETILQALKRMDEVGYKLLILGKPEQYENLVSIGDIQRGLINGIDVNEQLKLLPISAKEISDTSESDEKRKRKLIEMKAPFIPVVSAEGVVVAIKFWENYTNVSKHTANKLNGIKVVIMAGGKGTRLQPITNIIPKPLVPIGKKPILEHIIQRFRHYGATDFLISVNYKASMIKNYFEDLQTNYTLNYFHEDIPLGTAGSLSLVRQELTDTFFVSNCDILIDDDYENMLTYHRSKKNDITIIGCLKSYDIPYGIMTTTSDGMLDELQEKPTNTYLINTGMYILEPSVLAHVPEDTFFHITELIQKVKDLGGSVGIFPISEGSWKDIGEWPEYLRNYVQI